MPLGSLILTANRSILENDDVVLNSEFGVVAISLATLIIEEARGKSFDDAVVNSATHPHRISRRQRCSARAPVMVLPC